MSGPQVSGLTGEPSHQSVGTAGVGFLESSGAKGQHLASLTHGVKNDRAEDHTASVHEGDRPPVRDTQEQSHPGVARGAESAGNVGGGLGGGRC